MFIPTSCVSLDFLDGNFVAGCFDGVYEICDREFVSVAILEG